MMHKLCITGISLPEIMVAESRNDAIQCRLMGIPYIMKPQGWSDDRLVKCVLYRTVKRMFPSIDWERVLGVQEAAVKGAAWIHCPTTEGGGGGDDDLHTHDAGQKTDGYRKFDADGKSSQGMGIKYAKKAFDAVCEEALHEVDIDVLQRLHMLPTFLDDTVEAIRTNLENLVWADGWNRKLGMHTGEYTEAAVARNLIVLDVSSSIPSSISTTMLSLIDTMRISCQADLIVTGGISIFYPFEEDLPTPEEIRAKVPRSNESRMFKRILRDHVTGRHFGNVIVFGDNDNPWIDRNEDADLVAGTQVDNVLAFHTYHNGRMPGYGLWTQMLASYPEVSYDTSWTHEIKR